MGIEVEFTEEQAQALVDAGFEHLGDYQEELSKKEMDRLQKALRRLTESLE